MENTTIIPLESTQTNYNSKDINLLNSIQINREFGAPEDVIELHIISPSGDILLSDYNYNDYTNRNTIDNSKLYDSIDINPELDLEQFGFTYGKFNMVYNFQKQLFNSSNTKKFYIKDISGDRTEIKISRNDISFQELSQLYLNYLTKKASTNYYSDFILNIGDNINYIGVNIALDNNTTEPSLYIKLYEPLPQSLNIKDTLWLAETISDSYSFEINKELVVTNNEDIQILRGPNINLELNNQVNITTPYFSISNLMSNNQTSSYQKLTSILEENSIDINIDYNDFSNFIHFSSIRERLSNFVYKLNQVQSLQEDLSNLSNITHNLNFISSSKILIEKKINDIIEKLDGYEYFLYFESGSNSFPKTNDQRPYINVPVSSIEAINWIGSDDPESSNYGGKMLDAFNYDIHNRDYIWNTLPEYIKEDSQNANLELFVSMLGQHFDYIWTYIKDITNLKVADNRLDFGISKDIVGEALKSLGINLYTNSRNQEDIYLSILGINPNGGFLPSTGSLAINDYITASQYTIPENDIAKETYKRIYHNLPYLLKTRGTRKGLRALINCFGIPETILSIKEYGGNDKESGTINQIEEYFSYGNYGNTIIPWKPLNSQFIKTGFDDIVADTIEFRFKLNPIIQNTTQSLFHCDNGVRRFGVDFLYTTGSVGNLVFYMNGNFGIVSSSISSLPILNNDWWNIKIDRDIIGLRSNQIAFDTNYEFIVKNVDDEGKIGFESSSSLFIEGLTSSSYNNSWNSFSGSSLVFSPIEGLIQEIRLWEGRINNDSFNNHVLNPNSFVGNDISSSYQNLVFRASLGNELDLNNTSSIHPKSSGLDKIDSFIFNSVTSSNYIISSSFSSSYDTRMVVSPNIGSFTQVDDKIKIIDDVYIPGDTLSREVSIQNFIPNYKTRNLNKVDVAISPQDDINEDIINQLGYFNIDEYIGNPKYASLNNYPALDKLRDDYFKKYISKSNIFDLIKLLSYFDNSLFKMIKDFVPARTNLSTGLVIKPHILERNKVERHEPIVKFNDYSSSIEVGTIEGTNPMDLDLNTDYSSSIKYINGELEISNTDRREPFTGEFGGTEIIVHSQSLDNIVYELNKLDPFTSNSGIIKNYSRIPIDPTLNNVINPRKSKKFIDLDYSSDIITPVNYNFVTKSLFPNLNLTSVPFLEASVQDSNYTLRRHINPRYRGSKNPTPPISSFASARRTNIQISKPQAPVDSSSIKFVYFQEITSQSLTLPGRSNVYIKYLIDADANVIELTQQNKNLFDVQDIFNNRKSIDISLDDNQKPSKQKRLDGLKSIYAGGFRFSPILQNLSTATSTHSNLGFVLDNDIQVLNTDNEPAKQDLDINSLIINSIGLESTPINSSPIGEQSITLVTLFNSKLLCNVARNTPYSGEIIQRITGSVTIRTTISSPTNLNTQFFQNSNGTGQSWVLPLGDYPNIGIDPNYPNMNDNVRSIKPPFGVNTSTWGHANFMQFQGSYNGNGTLINIEPALGGEGVTSIRNIKTPTSTSVFYNSIYNDFGGPTIPSQSQGTYGLDGPMSFELTYNIEGLIILPEGSTSGNVILKTLGGIDGRISGGISFAHPGFSRIHFTNLPEILPNPLYRVNNPYYYTSPPDYLYITGTIDNGFNSGSASDENWYFERGNNGISGSLFNILTGSYDLSYMYYNYIIAGNNITQTFPTFSQYGYEDVMDKFTPKLGDLCKFYNYDKDSFTLDFENEIIKINPPQSQPISGSYNNRLTIELRKEIPNQACLDYSVSGSLGRRIQNFIFLSKIPDETNIVINSVKNTGQTSTGIGISDDISPEIKQQAGNIVKKLKSQNLI